MAKAKKVKELDFKAMRAKLDKEHSTKIAGMNKNIQKQIDKHTSVMGKLQTKLDAGTAANKPPEEMQELRDSIADHQTKISELQTLISQSAATIPPSSPADTTSAATDRK
jgi:uncharacterized coiled-coil DUF342 family protein